MFAGFLVPFLLGFAVDVELMEYIVDFSSEFLVLLHK
jgi:hypothetical protein